MDHVSVCVIGYGFAVVGKETVVDIIFHGAVGEDGVIIVSDCFPIRCDGSDVASAIVGIIILVQDGLTLMI